jgi:hypothetical protein
MEKGVVSLKKTEQGRNGERQRKLLSYLVFGSDEIGRTIQ